MQKEIINILGVNISTLNYKESQDFIVKRILNNEKTFVATPNPEILLLAEKDENYKKILNSTDLNTPDGIGLLYASKLIKLKNKSSITIKERVSGSDMMISICSDKRLYGKKIFLLGASENVAKKTAQTLKEKFPKINIVGTFSGKHDESDDDTSIKLINDSKAEIVFVAFGAPKQENWINRNRLKLPTATLFMGIGGSFDFISGEKKRAPFLMRKLGLEWLYRLFIEPKRFKRIFNAVVIFPYRLIKNLYFNQ